MRTQYGISQKKKPDLDINEAPRNNNFGDRRDVCGPRLFPTEHAVSAAEDRVPVSAAFAGRGGGDPDSRSRYFW